MFWPIRRSILYFACPRASSLACPSVASTNGTRARAHASHAPSCQTAAVRRQEAEDRALLCPETRADRRSVDAETPRVRHRHTPVRIDDRHADAKCAGGLLGQLRGSGLALSTIAAPLTHPLTIGRMDDDKSLPASYARRVEDCMTQTRRRVLGAGAALVAAAPALAQRPAATPAAKAGRSSIVPATTIPIVGSEQGVPGAPHLLHRPQLSRTRARNGVGSAARAALLLPEADGRRAICRARHDGRPSLSDADEELSSRDRADRVPQNGRPRHPRRTRRSTTSTAIRSAST